MNHIPSPDTSDAGIERLIQTKGKTAARVTPQDIERGHPIIYSPQHQRINDWEGQVVRCHRTPDEPSATGCRHCGRDMHDHGWVDTLEGGHIVCPGDWVITGVAGEHYPASQTSSRRPTNSWRSDDRA